MEGDLGIRETCKERITFGCTDIHALRYLDVAKPNGNSRIHILERSLSILTPRFTDLGSDGSRVHVSYPPSSAGPWDTRISRTQNLESTANSGIANAPSHSEQATRGVFSVNREKFGALAGLGPRQDGNPIWRRRFGGSLVINDIDDRPELDATERSLDVYLVVPTGFIDTGPCIDEFLITGAP